MSSNEMENDIEPEIPAKRMKIDEKDSNKASRKLSIILQREIETEIKLRKNDLDTIEENIFLTKRHLLRLKQGVVTDYYKEKNQKDYLQYPPHPAIKDTFLGKSPRNNVKIETPETDAQEDLFVKEEIKKEPEDVVIKEEDNISCLISKPLECPKPPCYIPPKPVKVETVKPPEPRGFVSKKHLRIVVGNVSKWLAPKECAGATHKWTVYTKSADPDVDLSDFVSKVVFFLHPSYKPNDVISVIEPPFKLTRRGWGEFPLKARFHFKNSLDLPVDVMHLLKLDHKHTGLETFGSETTLAVWIHLPAKEEPFQESFNGDSDFLETKTAIDTRTSEHDFPKFKEECAFQKIVDDFCLDEKTINKNSLDEFNTSFTKEDIENFLLDETNLANLSFPGEFLNCLSEPEQNNILMPDSVDSSSQNNVKEEKPSETEVGPPHEGFDSKNSISSDIQPYEEFLEECNVVESEVVIDCDNHETLEGSEEILDTQESYDLVDDVIYHTNQNNDTSNKPSLKTSEINGKENVMNSHSTLLESTHFEIPNTPSKNERDGSVIVKEENRPSINSNVSYQMNLEETNSQEMSTININNGVIPKTDTPIHGTVPDASLALKKIQNSPGALSKSVNIKKHLLKGKVITILKGADNPFNILGSKKNSKQVVLSTLKSNNPSFVIIKSNDRPSFKAHASGNESSISNVSLPKSEIKLALVKDLPNLSLRDNVALPSGKSFVNSISGQDKAMLSVNSSSAKSINLDQNKHPSISNLFSESKKKKKAVSNKEVKSTVITLQKENGQVILRKEAKFKECKETIASTMLVKDKSQVLIGDLKSQDDKLINNKQNIVSEENNLSVSSTNSSFLKMELSSSSYSNLSVGGKQVIVVNPKNFKIRSKQSLAQKIVTPAVSLLKKSNQESSSFIIEEEVKDSSKESVLLKRCPTQSTEIAVSWLMKRLPLVDSRAQLTGFRNKHPYCAKSRDDFLNWPFPKQRAAEWMRAKAVEKILEKLPGIPKWSTLEIWDWARIRAFTPMKTDSGLNDLPIQSDNQYFYSQPTEEIIDFIKRCKDLKEKEVVDVVTTDELQTKIIPSSSFSPPVSSRKTAYKFNLTSTKDETPFEPELKGMRKFVNECQRNVGATSSPEPLCPGILYPSAERMLISAFYSVAEDIIRRAHNSSYIRHSEKSPSEINIDDVKHAILSRKEFDFLVPSKTEKKERPPVTILPNFS